MPVELSNNELSPEVIGEFFVSNVMGLFKESEYGAMYAIPSLLTLSLFEGTSDFMEDANLWAAKMEVFQRALWNSRFKALEALKMPEQTAVSCAPSTGECSMDGAFNHTSKLGKPGPPGSSDAPMAGPSSRLIV